MKRFRYFAGAVALVALASCASIEKMETMVDAITVKVEPAVLEVVAGEIDAVVTVTYPKDYFNPKAVLEVTPVLVYDGGEARMAPFMYQGEKVKDNYKVVSSDGQTVVERVHFDYVEGMENSFLELRGVAKSGSKQVNLPSVKVADGANTTYMLAKAAGVLDYKADAYQDVLVQTAEGQILYQLNSADVRGSELRGRSVKDFQAALDAINANERASITGTEIVAYASPDGSEDLNTKLSDRRSSTAGKAWRQITKGHEAAAPEIRSVGEDWEGFRELVGKSNIPDKELILRVLSMYSDPAVRENEIKNMSQVYTALKGEVLPELRRARLIANVEVQNYTAEELLALLDENTDVLDEEALLRAATLVKDGDQKEAVYKKAIAKFDSDRARYNLAVLYLQQGKTVKAEEALSRVHAGDADVVNAIGVLALRKGDLATAANSFAKAGNAANKGLVEILTGQYDAAAKTLADVQGCCHNTALAYILTDQLDKAEAAIHCECPKCVYLKAIIAARRGDAAGVKAHLATVAQKDADLARRAKTDIEFAGYEF